MKLPLVKKHPKKMLGKFFSVESTGDSMWGVLEPLNEELHKYGFGLVQKDDGTSEYCIGIINELKEG